VNRKEEVSIKERRLRELIQSLELDGVLLKKQGSFSWITAGGINMVPVCTEIGFSTILITKTDKFIIADRIESARNMEEEGLKELGFTLLEYNWFESCKEIELIKKIVPSMNLGCDISIYGLQNIEEKLKEIRFSLLPPEIERYLWMGEKTSEAIESVLIDFAEPGKTEAEITGELTKRLWKHRIDPVGYQAAADERAYKYRHPIPTEKKVEKSLMLCVMARKWGLITTITRLVNFGIASEKLIKQYEDNVYLESSIIAETRPGKRTDELFRNLCNLYEKYGYKDEWKLHNQGGSMGYDVRDYGFSNEVQKEVKENQAFCWNPSISGTKSEDGFIVMKEGFEFITKPVIFPKIEIKIGEFVFTRPGLLEK